MVHDREYHAQNAREEPVDDVVDFSTLTVSFFKSIPGALIFLDSHWRLVYLNDEAKKLFEAKIAPLMGRPYEEIYPKKMKLILAPSLIETLLKRKDKSATSYSFHFKKWFKVSAISSDIGIFIWLEDVTKEMTATRFLRLNEFSVDNSIDMVFWINPAGHIIYVNKATCGSLGYAARELTGMKVVDIDPSYDDNTLGQFIRELKGSGSITYESSLRARDRSLIPVEVTCCYLEYYQDEYIISFARDTTERKKAEEELRRAQSDLEKKVEARTSELTKEKTESELYLDLMGHDISNINQIIEAQLELAQEIMAEKGNLEGEEKELIDTPLQALERSNRIIDRVRKLQKLRAGEYTPEAIDIDRLIADVADDYSSVPGRDVAIDHPPAQNRFVMANPLLKDAFGNLVGNAIKHSNGPVRIGITVDTVNENGSPFYRVSIEDNGPGIPDDKKKMVFHRFMRGPTHARGTGLGLYIVQTLVESFHGRVKVEDRVPGDHTKGSRFLVYLPVLESEHGQ